MHALVLGASKSIGQATAKALWEAGHNVTCVARSFQNEKSERWETIRSDLMLDGADQRLASQIQPPNIIVHALGGSQGITDTWASSSDWQTVWRLNLGVAHNINRRFVPKMIENGWGRIVHVSSISTKAHIGYGPYASSKAAVEGYVSVVGKELAPKGVIMTCVAPGAIWTEGRYFANLPENQRNDYINAYIPTGRLGRAEEVAKVIAFLCSDASSYMAGAIVRVDGGGR